MNKIQWDFISECEGKGITVGYQPTNNSGVTIATGFDLKEKDDVFCRSIGISEPIIEKFKKYFGLSGSYAAKVAKNLTLSEEEVFAVDVCSKKYYSKNLIKQFNSFKPVKKFEELTSEQQTVLASVGFQYGSYSRTPTFIKYAAHGEWDNVINELNNFGDAYETRRKKEAAFLNGKI